MRRPIGSTDGAPQATIKRLSSSYVTGLLVAIGALIAVP
jgi:hypothetical protein